MFIGSSVAENFQVFTKIAELIHSWAFFSLQLHLGALDLSPLGASSYSSYYLGIYNEA